MLDNGLIEVAGVEPGAGPERKRYAITDAGVTELSSWLSTPEKPATYLQSALYTKVVLALLSGRSAGTCSTPSAAPTWLRCASSPSAKSGGDLATQLVCGVDLHHTFGATPALAGASVTARAGEILAVMGPSGSGNSTRRRVHAVLGALGTPRAVLSWAR